MTGRPTKLNPDLQDRLCQVLRSGNTRTAACAYVGIHYSTFLDWLDRGKPGTDRDPDGIYTAFSEAVAKAESAAEIRNVSIIQQAASDSWQAAAWWLERRRPKDYSRHSVHVHDTKTNDTVQVTFGGKEGES